MKSRRRMVLLGGFLVVAVVVVMIAGCGGESTGDTADTTGTTTAMDFTGPAEVRSVLTGPQGPPSGETPYYGGTLTILHQYGPTNFGAWWEPTAFMDYQVARFAVEQLAGLDEDGGPVPQLAESWDWNEDFTEVTFHLRQGVKFHDGTDLNAEAVRWNLQMMIDGPKTAVDAATDIEVVDEYTVKVTLAESDPLFVQNLIPTGCGKITSPAAYEEYGPVQIKRNPVGTGPFKMTSFAMGKEVVFERNEDYWQEGLPYLDEVKFVIVPDYQTRKTAFLNGEGQIMYGLNYVDAGEIEATGGSVQSRLMALITLAGNSDDPTDPSSDIKVRQAISYAVDIPTIVSGVYEGFVEPTNQLALPGDRAWQQAAWNDDIVGYPYNPEKARQLLAESEYNISVDNPWKTTLTYLSSEDYDQVFTLVKGYLDEVGIEVTLQPLEFAAWATRNASGWEGIGAMSISYNPESEYSSTLQIYLNRDAYQFGNNIYIPDEYQALYEEMINEIDLEKRYEMCRELNKMAIDDYCLVTPMYALLGNIAVASELKDNVWCVYSSGEYLVEQIWLEQ